MTAVVNGAKRLIVIHPPPSGCSGDIASIERHGSGFYVDTDDGQSHAFAPVLHISRPDGVNYDQVSIGVAQEVANPVVNDIQPSPSPGHL